MRHPLAAPLAGWYLDAPRHGSRQEDDSLYLIGWVAGVERSAVAVEVVVAGKLLRRIPISLDRADVAAAFPALPALRSGFNTRLPLVPPVATDLELRAVLAGDVRVPLATLRLERRWRESIEPGGAKPTLVSVVITCPAPASFLADAIASVRDQTWPRIDVVVVEAGAPGGAAEVVARFPGVRHIAVADPAREDLRNTGIRRTLGDLLVFLDADSRLLPGAVQAGVDALAARPECAIAAGGGAFPEAASGSSPATTLLTGDIVPLSAVLFRRSALEAMGNFDPSAGVCMGWDLLLRVARRYPIGFHAEPVVERRESPPISPAEASRRLRASLTVLGRQRRHARSRPELARARRCGFASVRSAYGRSIADGVRQSLRAGAWGDAAAGMRTLLTLHPRGLGALLGRGPTLPAAALGPARVTGVELAAVDQTVLWGSYLDSPRSGALAARLEIAGWVLSRGVGAEAVEVVHQGVVVYRTRVAVLRPDVAAHFPEAAGADHTGFQFAIESPPGESVDLEVRAVLAGARRVAIAGISLSRERVP